MVLVAWANFAYIFGSVSWLLVIKLKINYLLNLTRFIITFTLERISLIFLSILILKFLFDLPILTSFYFFVSAVLNIFIGSLLGFLQINSSKKYFLTGVFFSSLFRFTPASFSMALSFSIQITSFFLLFGHVVALLLLYLQVIDIKLIRQFDFFQKNKLKFSKFKEHSELNNSKELFIFGLFSNADIVFASAILSEAELDLYLTGSIVSKIILSLLSQFFWIKINELLSNQNIEIYKLLGVAIFIVYFFWIIFYQFYTYMKFLIPRLEILELGYLALPWVNYGILLALLQLIVWLKELFTKGSVLFSFTLPVGVMIFLVSFNHDSYITAIEFIYLLNLSVLLAIVFNKLNPKLD